VYRVGVADVDTVRTTKPEPDTRRADPLVAVRLRATEAVPLIVALALAALVIVRRTDPEPAALTLPLAALVTDMTTEAAPY